MKTILSGIGNADQWRTWTPRAEIAPIFQFDPRGGRQGKPGLKIAAEGNPAAIGAWQRQVNVSGGKVYRLVAWYRTEGVRFEQHSVSARLDWHDEKDRRPRQPDNAIAQTHKEGWARIEYVTHAPAEAKTVSIELELRWAPGGVVWWDEVELTELDEAPKRPVRIGTVFHRPRGTKSPAESVEQFCRLIEKSEAKADLICLPEGITVVGTGKTYVEVAESLPGPTTARLGELAKSRKSYVVAGLYERVGGLVYNTSVLISRSGELIGSYRKTHLPQEEVASGLTPGRGFPVFQTDIGKIGMMICWDLQFPEPARRLALEGAEIIALPIWGGNETLAKARAIENHIHLVSSTYDMKSFVVDPTGKVLADATAKEPFVVAEADLAANHYQPWLGDMRWRTWKERQPG